MPVNLVYRSRCDNRSVVVVRVRRHDLERRVKPHVVEHVPAPERLYHLPQGRVLRHDARHRLVHLRCLLGGCGGGEYLGPVTAVVREAVQFQPRHHGRLAVLLAYLQPQLPEVAQSILADAGEEREDDDELPRPELDELAIIRGLCAATVPLDEVDCAQAPRQVYVVPELLQFSGKDDAALVASLLRDRCGQLLLDAPGVDAVLNQGLGRRRHPSAGSSWPGSWATGRVR